MRNAHVLVLLSLLALTARPSQAAGNSIVYGSLHARDCFVGANLASLSAQSTLPICDRALTSQKMSRRERASTLVNRGILHTHLRNFAAAMDDFERALELLPGFAEARLNRGNAFLFIGEFERAVEDYGAAIEGRTRKPHAAYYNRGLAREALKQPKLAYQDFSRAAELRPSWSLAVSRLELYAGWGYAD